MREELKNKEDMELEQKFEEVCNVLGDDYSFTFALYGKKASDKNSVVHSQSQNIGLQEIMALAELLIEYMSTDFDEMERFLLFQYVEEVRKDSANERHSHKLVMENMNED